MEKFPTLHLIVRHGAPASIALAIAAAGLVLWLTFSSLGWPAVPVSALAGGIAYILARSYVELVVLITEMLLPH